MVFWADKRALTTAEMDHRVRTRRGEMVRTCSPSPPDSSPWPSSKYPTGADRRMPLVQTPQQSFAIPGPARGFGVCGKFHLHQNSPDVAPAKAAGKECRFHKFLDGL